MKPIRARIALAIDSTGRWNAAGGSDRTAPEAAAEAHDNLVDPVGLTATAWILADVDVPEAVEIEGEVERSTPAGPA